ncbi:hypothetical protein [Streptomyces apocyni]|uniref:hypothetical protein n=1 Tax=Streptomyces apocyni TaxID=2654677 RepID=UPI0012E9D8F1|nr:hypothetical protein [Streptomyces apocyni]
MSVTAAQGFLASGVAAGVKESPDLDPALDASAMSWTNDLTAEYVHENSAYSS